MARTRGRRLRGSTRVHADAREGHNVAGGLAVGGPTGKWALVIGLGR